MHKNGNCREKGCISGVYIWREYFLAATPERGALMTPGRAPVIQKTEKFSLHDTSLHGTLGH